MNSPLQEKRLIPTSEFMQAVKESVNIGYEADFTVTGNSMWPLLAHGRDRVIIKKYSAEGIKKGDIVLFEAVKDKYLLHRVMHVTPTAFVTTGDANTFEDGTFPKESIIGYVTHIIRKGKKIPINNFPLKIYTTFWISAFKFRGVLLKGIKLFIKIKNFIR